MFWLVFCELQVVGQAEILQERAEGCIQVDLQKKIRQDKRFCRGGFWS